MAAHPLLARSLKLKKVAMLRFGSGVRPTPDQISNHIGWVIVREAEGVIFLSGPTGNSESGLMGITILHVDTIDEADGIVRNDPFVVDGIIRYELVEWTIYEGALSFSARISEGGAAIP